MTSTRRISCLGLALAASALALSGASGSALTKAAKSCSARGTTTVLQTPELRVFTRRLNINYDLRTVACRRSDGKRFKLAESEFDARRERVHSLDIAGRWLAYAVTVGTSNNTYGKACALNFRSGKRRCGLGLSVHGLGVTPAGSIAWLADSGIVDDELVCCSVFKRDAGASKNAQLDEGEDIERSSFAVGGNRIYWTKAGAPQSASMP